LAYKSNAFLLHIALVAANQAITMSPGCLAHDDKQGLVLYMLEMNNKKWQEAQVFTSLE
jgi:hypothetical protein